MKVTGNQSVKIIPLGGLEQIGMNITAFEYEDSIIVVDCGLAFPDDEMLGIDLVIPDITYLKENASKVKGLVITHGHEDHIGAIPYALKELNMPIYATKLTMGLIENKLKEHNLKLFFYPHYEMQKYISMFKSSNDHIVIADFDSYDVQELLKKSKLLITDYSSVFFDFAYMLKPCIYYQFDVKDFTEQHYGKGYFDYEKDGFGKVVSDSETLIEEIVKIINRNFKLEEQYSSNICRFFQKHDTNNCQRIFEEIRKL